MKKPIRNSRICKTLNQFKPIRKDIIFCMHYLKIAQPLAVYVDRTHMTHYMQFFRNEKLCYEAYFINELETTLLYAYEALNETH